MENDVKKQNKKNNKNTRLFFVVVAVVKINDELKNKEMISK